MTPLSPCSQSLRLCGAMFLPLRCWQTSALQGSFTIWDPLPHCFPKEFNGAETAYTGAGRGAKKLEGGFQCFRVLSLHFWRKLCFLQSCIQWEPTVLGWSCASSQHSHLTETHYRKCPAVLPKLALLLISDHQDSYCTTTAWLICPCFTLLFGLLFGTFFGAETWWAPLEGPQVIWRSLSCICHPLELKYNEIYK